MLIDNSIRLSKKEINDYWLSAMKSEDVAESMKLFIVNYCFDDLINPIPFINNLWADHLLFKLALNRIANHDIQLERHYKLSLEDVKIHWDYPSTDGDIMFFKNVLPDQYLTSIVFKFAHQGINLFTSPNSYSKEEAQYFPEPSTSFKNNFITLNRFRINMPPCPWLRYFLVAYPDIVGWYYNVGMQDLKLSEKIASVLVNDSAFSIADTKTRIFYSFRPLIEFYKTEISRHPLECSFNNL